MLKKVIQEGIREKTLSVLNVVRQFTGMTVPWLFRAVTMQASLTFSYVPNAPGTPTFIY